MAKRVLTTIGIPSNITEHPKYQDLTETRQLSSVISELLYNYLNISKSENQDINKLERQLEKTEEKKSNLVEQIRKLKEAEKEELAQKKLKQEEAEKMVDAIKMAGVHRRL